MKYRLMTDEERQKYTPELVGRGHVVVSDESKFWIVKHKPGSTNQEKYDLLGYLMGRGFANVAEVRLLSKQEHEQVRILASKDVTSTPNNTFLVRLAGDYSLEELPCKTLNEAVASELIYSTWIRRRDAHANNRAYINGVPIFFDHETGFLGQEEYADIKTFFKFLHRKVLQVSGELK